jgi:hypothetical protein
MMWYSTIISSLLKVAGGFHRVLVVVIIVFVLSSNSVGCCQVLSGFHIGIVCSLCCLGSFRCLYQTMFLSYYNMRDTCS